MVNKWVSETIKVSEKTLKEISDYLYNNNSNRKLYFDQNKQTHKQIHRIESF